LEFVQSVLIKDGIDMNPQWGVSMELTFTLSCSPHQGNLRRSSGRSRMVRPIPSHPLTVIFESLSMVSPFKDNVSAFDQRQIVSRVLVFHAAHSWDACPPLNAISAPHLPQVTVRLTATNPQGPPGGPVKVTLWVSCSSAAMCSGA
jgi:hypothetical protein